MLLELVAQPLFCIIWNKICLNHLSIVTSANILEQIGRVTHRLIRVQAVCIYTTVAVNMDIVKHAKYRIFSNIIGTKRLNIINRVKHLTEMKSSESLLHKHYNNR